MQRVRSHEVPGVNRTATTALAGWGRSVQEGLGGVPGRARRDSPQTSGDGQGSERCSGVY